MKTRIIKAIAFVATLSLAITASAQSSHESGDDSANLALLFIVGILVLGGLVGALFLLKRDRHGSPKSRPCPICGSSNTANAARGRPGISIPAHRQCTSCGASWRPECSLATAVMTTVTGFVLLGLAAGSTYAAFFFCLDDLRRGDSVTLAFFIAWGIFSALMFAASILLLGRGIKLLRGDGRALEILSRGKDAVVEHKSHDEAPCLGCGAVMAPGVTVCPQCGWTYGTLSQSPPA